MFCVIRKVEVSVEIHEQPIVTAPAASRFIEAKQQGRVFAGLQASVERVSRDGLGLPPDPAWWGGS
jgi:hypothetical protein